MALGDFGGEPGLDPRMLVARAATSGLAGIAVLRAPLDDAALAVLTSEADRRRMFVLAPGGRL